MNAGELKKILKDIPHHFEILALRDDGTYYPIEACVEFGFVTPGRPGIEVQGERRKRSNALLLNLYG